MALDCKSVLLFARDSIFFGHELAGHSHMEVFVRVPQPVVNHGVNEPSIAQAISGARLRQKIRRVGHGLHATSDDDLGFPELNGLPGQCYGLEARAADFVDGQSGNARITAPFERGLAGRVLSEARLEDVAEDRFVNLFGVQARAANAFGYSLGAEFWRRETGEATLEFSAGGR